MFTTMGFEVNIYRTVCSLLPFKNLPKTKVLIIGSHFEFGTDIRYANNQWRAKKFVNLFFVFGRATKTPYHEFIGE